MSLGWGILATGGIARAFASDLNTAGLRIAAAGSRRQESADRFAAEFGAPHAHGSYEALVDDPTVDIVYVATPHPQHVEAATLALEAGKHVLVEKAFTVNRGEAERLRALAAERGLVAMEAMWTRYLPHMRRAHEIVDAGTLGDMRMLTATHAQALPTDPAHRLNDLALGGGALLDLGVYPVSFAWDFAGRPTSVQATARFAETGADTDVAVVMSHESGAISTSVSTSRAAGLNTAHILGTTARIDIESYWLAQATFTVTATDGTVLERFEERIDGRGMQMQAIAAERAVAEGASSPAELTIDETVEIMGTLDEIRAQIGLAYPGE
ncbi:Gfo/Idh/MocA family protein [Microbacterium halophytorum]|uniref:Gfo/Idh/MocA family protein n=1 Tax=Microbacterium halophytorum TaxID=2067568 RepID=UPI000CFA9E40|nr:Gfo/Idh/MocA family oxidoreductase [Microbacterium halophytorum]